MCLFKGERVQIKSNLDILKFSFSVTLAVFQVVNSHMWLVSPLLEDTDMEQVHHHRKFYWKLLSEAWTLAKAKNYIPFTTVSLMLNTGSV